MTNIYAKGGPFTDGLERELELYREIERITLEERAVLQESDPAARLLPLLERKNSILGEIAEIENRITAFKSGWKDHSGISADEKTHIAGLVREIGDVLRALISGEISAEEKLNERYPDHKPETRSATSHRGLGGLAMAAYGRK